MAKSHPAGMHICYAIFAGISLRLCYISLRSFRITFAAYLPTHIKSLRDFFQTKGTVLLVCLWHIQTKRTVPLVCGLCAIVYCKNNQGCGLISTALILYDFIGIICGAWWRSVLRLSVCCARLRHGVPNCHACHVADGVKPCRLRSRCADDPSCSQPFAAIAIAG